VAEEGILEACRCLGIAFVAHSPLGRGFLAGAIPNRETLDASDWRRDNPRVSDEALAENARYVGLIRDVAVQKGATAAPVALASVLA